MITQENGQIKIIDRLNNSKMGNPQFIVQLKTNDSEYYLRTGTNASLAYWIENVVNTQGVGTITLNKYSNFPRHQIINFITNEKSSK